MMAAALDLATVVTREFVRGELPKPGSRSLEVGCGNGRLASAERELRDRASAPVAAAAGG